MILSGSCERGRPVLLLAHGAGAGELHPWMRRTAEGLAARGVTVATFNFPYMQAGRKVPDRGDALEAALAEAWRELIGGPAAGAAPLFVGGKSMGGRIATQAVAHARLRPVPAGIVCFGYPLHPPSKPTVRRDAHLPALGCPVLFLHGTRDPFGTPAEMTEMSAAVPRSTLHLVDGGDHSLTVRGRDSLSEALDVAAAWIGAQALA